MKYLILTLLFTAALQAEPSPKEVYWDGIEGQKKGDADARELGKEYPYLAKLRVSVNASGKAWVGSGGLISNSWVITAKHVVKAHVNQPENFNIQVRFPDGTTRKVVGSFSHPERDIAILKLDKPVNSIKIPSLQSHEIAPDDVKFDLPMTITGANGSYIAYDVLGHVHGAHLLSPDILRGGDSGSPVVALNAKGEDVIIGTLMGGLTLRNKGEARFIGNNMRYARFAATGGIHEWIREKIKSSAGEEPKIRWSEIKPAKVKVPRETIYRGSPEYQLNNAVYLYQNGRIKEAKKLILELLPQLSGKSSKKIAQQLLSRKED